MKKEIIIKEENKVSKYLIEYDEDVLKKFRKEICKKCGLRRHIHDKKVNFVFKEEDRFLVENYKNKIIGSKEYDYGSKDICEVDYDIILEPKLSVIIKEFLDKNENNLINLLLYNNYDLEEKNTFDVLIKSFKEKAFNLLKEDKIDDLKKVINDLDNLYSDKRKNEKLNLENQSDYVLKLKTLIKINKIDEMSIIEYNKFVDFTNKVKVLEFK